MSTLSEDKLAWRLGESRVHTEVGTEVSMLVSYSLVVYELLCRVIESGGAIFYIVSLYLLLCARRSCFSPNLHTCSPYTRALCPTLLARVALCAFGPIDGRPVRLRMVGNGRVASAVDIVGLDVREEIVLLTMT
jgi:hypothetical protein